MAEKEYPALVQKVFPDGHHGPYAKARSEEIGSVTFALQAPAWRHDAWPEEGVWVMVTRLRRKRAGWRAERARFFEPRDETTAITETTDKRKV